MSSPIVAKFGGTSVASAEQLHKLAAIVRSDSRRRYVVVSAPGKRVPQDKKITDLLYLCYQVAQQGVDVGPTFSHIRERYEEIARDLGVKGIVECLDSVAAEIQSGTSEDWIASRGEYIHARLIAVFLGATFVDAADCIRFGPGGQFDPEQTYVLLAEQLQGDGLFVIPGFYGTDMNGNIKTFSRGGSDVTGAIVARAMNAEVYENWTDVSGLLMTDPRIVENPRPIHEVTYRELRELAYMGANVLHDEAVFPVREANIPIHIKNTNRPEDPGTRIVLERVGSEDVIVGVAGRKGFTTLFIEKALMNQERGFGRQVLEILEHHGISWEHTPTSIDSMSVIVHSEMLKGKEHRVMEQIRRVLQPDRLDVLHNLAMIATVGIGMSHQVGIAGRLFAGLGEAGINIRMINQGASEINIIVGVEEPDFENAIRTIYNTFVQ